ncbi:MAG: SRPBCC family protein [Gemmatimonadales bacterium]
MTASDGGEVLVVRRVLPASRERVFAAWLDPESLAQWMRVPGGSAAAEVEVDPRVGGRFRITMRHGGGQVGHRGEYLAIDPPRRLEFTWISVYTDTRPTVVTVELHEREGGTELVLTHRRLPPSRVDAHRQGWTDIVRNLGAYLGADAAR